MKSKWWLIISSLLLADVGLAAGRLVVFYPTPLVAKDIEKALASDSALNGAEVVVFSKYREFEGAVRAEGAAAILAPASYAEADSACKPVQQLTRGGKDSFTYRLIAIADRKAKDFAQAELGMVQQVGRAEQKAFVARIIPGANFKSIKTVAKAEDVFPLLALENADYILVEPQIHDAMKRLFTTKTKLVRESIDVRLPVVCGKGDAGLALAARIGKLSNASLKAIGFEGIRKVEQP